MCKTEVWSDSFTFPPATVWHQIAHVVVHLSLVILLLFTAPSLHAAAPIILDSPPRLAVESLAQIEKNNPAFSMLLEAKFEKGSIRIIGNGQYIVAAKDGWWHMYDLAGNQLIKPGKLKFQRLGGSNRSPIYNTPRFDDGYGAYKMEVDGKKRSVFIDIHGNKVIDKMFFNASAFNNGVARVQGINKKYWFIDTKGKALTPEYKELNFIQGERVFFSTDGKLWGLMDDHFKLIVKPRYKNVGGFSNGAELTSVQDKNGLWGYIDKNGRMVIQPKYTYARSVFYNDMASVSIEPKGDKRAYYFIDKKGNPLFGDLKIYNPADFYDSIASVAMWKDVETCPGVIKNMFVYGAINTKGETVIPFVYERLASIHPGQTTIPGSYIEFKSSRGKCRYIKHVDVIVDRKGNAYNWSGELPKQVTPDTPFYEKLSIKGGSTKIEGKRRYGLNYYVEGEEEKVYIKPQFEKLKHLSGPIFRFLARTADGTVDGMKEGLIKISKVSDLNSKSHPKKAAVVDFFNTIKAKANALAKGRVVTEFDKLVAENERLRAERKQIMAEIDEEASRLAKQKTATYQPDVSHLEEPWNQRKALGELHDNNNVRIRELATTEEMKLFNAIAEFSSSLVPLMNQGKWDAADQLISSWSLSGEFGY